MSKDPKLSIGAEQLTLFPVDFPANPSALPERKKGKTTSETCGPRCVELFQRSNPLGFLLKMFVESSAHISTRFSLTWKVLATPASRSLFQLVRSELPTKENASGFWPTPRAGKTTNENEETWMKRYRSGKVSTPPLSLAVKMWPTPTVNDSRSGANRTAKRKPGSKHHDGITLVDATRMWPTPTKSDGKGGPGTYGREGGKNLRTAVNGQLNPMWVEWLMGLPTGWTDSNCLETAKSFRSSNGSGK